MRIERGNALIHHLSQGEDSDLFDLGGFASKVSRVSEGLKTKGWPQV